MSGMIVLVVAVSGCLLAFEAEIRGLMETPHKPESPSGDILPPSRLRRSAEEACPGESASRVVYRPQEAAAVVQFGQLKTPYYKLVDIDPTTGRVLHVQDMNADFFHVVFNVHYRLALPPAIGTKVVSYATLVFVVVCAAGLLVWWPRTWKSFYSHLTIRWASAGKRRVYDLHRVLAAWSAPVMILLALTGMIWGLPWFARTVHWAVSGGASSVMQAGRRSVSREGIVAPSIAQDSGPHRRGRMSLAETPEETSADRALRTLWDARADADELFVDFPTSPRKPIRIVVNPQRSTYYRTDHYHFDAATGQPVAVPGSWGRYSDATPADMVRRLNYDVHIGSIAGLPGKVTVFLASLVAATLPVSGFLISRRRKRYARLGSDARPAA